MDSGTKILSVSSNRSASQKQIMSNVPEDEHWNEFLSDEDYLNSFEVAQYVDDAQDHSLAYMASVLESKIMRAKPQRKIIKCEQCITVFIENELIEDSFIRFKARNNNILQPCKSTFEICKFVESFIKSCEGKRVSYQSIVMQIMRKMPFESLFNNSDFEHHDNESGHRYDFIKKIVESYMHMKSINVAKSFTLKLHDAPIRHRYKKLIQEQGQ